MAVTGALINSTESEFYKINLKSLNPSHFNLLNLLEILLPTNFPKLSVLAFRKYETQTRNKIRNTRRQRSQSFTVIAKHTPSVGNDCHRTILIVYQTYDSKVTAQ